MKSAYGLKIPEPDSLLTRVGPGTPCGELMRRYWQPVCLASELKDAPKRLWNDMLKGEFCVIASAIDAAAHRRIYIAFASSRRDVHG